MGSTVESSFGRWIWGTVRCPIAEHKDKTPEMQERAQPISSTAFEDDIKPIIIDIELRRDFGGFEIRA